MKKFRGFSLAEALITLLVVCIIAIATVPVITKKKRTPDNKPNTLWTVERETEATIYPAASRDIKLGELNPRKSQGIIVVGTLEFKSRDGRTIGWIKENGENSFSNTEEIVAKQQEIINALTNLTNDLKSALNNAPANNYNYDRYNNDASSNEHKVNGGISGRERLMRHGSGRDRLNYDSSNGIDMKASAEQISKIAQLQKEFDAMLQKNQ